MKVDLGDRNLLRKFLAIGRVLTEQAEAEYGIQVQPDQDFDYRIGHLRHVMLDNVADRLGVRHYNKSNHAITKLRHLTAVLELVELKHPQAGIDPSAEEFEWGMRECVKAYDFIVMKRDYLMSRPTPERFYEWLARYESLVLGKRPRMLGGEPSRLPRKAVVSFAKPFKLGDYKDDYKQDRKGTHARILQRLHDDIEDMLNRSEDLTYTLVDPYDVGGDLKP
jgi:hypothetical protein